MKTFTITCSGVTGIWYVKDQDRYPTKPKERWFNVEVVEKSEYDKVVKELEETKKNEQSN